MLEHLHVSFCSTLYASGNALARLCLAIEQVTCSLAQPSTQGWSQPAHCRAPSSMLRRASECSFCARRAVQHATCSWHSRQQHVVDRWDRWFSVASQRRIPTPWAVQWRPGMRVIHTSTLPQRTLVTQPLCITVILSSAVVLLDKMTLCILTPLQQPSASHPVPTRSAAYFWCQCLAPAGNSKNEWIVRIIWTCMVLVHPG